MYVCMYVYVHKLAFLLHGLFKQLEPIAETSEHLAHVAALLHADDASVVLLVHLRKGEKYTVSCCDLLHTHTHTHS